MIVFSLNFILMTFQAVGKLLGIRDVNVEKDNKKGEEKNKSTVILNECVSDSLRFYKSLQTFSSTFN